MTSSFKGQRNRSKSVQESKDENLYSVWWSYFNNALGNKKKRKRKIRLTLLALRQSIFNRLTFLTPGSQLEFLTVLAICSGSLKHSGRPAVDSPSDRGPGFWTAAPGPPFWRKSKSFGPASTCSWKPKAHHISLHTVNLISLRDPMCPTEAAKQRPHNVSLMCLCHVDRNDQKCLKWGLRSFF